MSWPWNGALRVDVAGLVIDVHAGPTLAMRGSCLHRRGAARDHWPVTAPCWRAGTCHDYGTGALKVTCEDGVSRVIDGWGLCGGGGGGGGGQGGSWKCRRETSDLTQLSIIMHMLVSISTCLLATTMPLPSDKPNNSRLCCCWYHEWVEHSPVWHKVNYNAPSE